MLVMVGGTLIQLFVGPGPLAIRLAALAFCGVPIVTARVRTVPNAVRLGARIDSLEVQGAMARRLLSFDRGLRGDPAPRPAVSGSWGRRGSPCIRSR
jgi:hypothetical protein